MYDDKLTEDLKKTIREVVRIELSSNLFTARKVTDTPTDDLQVVPRKYVNLYGTTANRPSSSVVSNAQKYFDTTIGRPVYFNPNSSVWTDGAGSIS